MKKWGHLLIIIIASYLTGCVLFAAGAGVATGAAVVNDRRSLQTMTDDQNIEVTANHLIKQQVALIKQAHVVVVAFNHAVLIVGQVPSMATKQQIENMVQSLPKVARIYNELTVGPATSAVIRSNDAWITTKVKTEMIATKDLRASQIKVVTENSTVYLMGIVVQGQANLATTVARHVVGVQKVVTLFQYMLM